MWIIAIIFIIMLILFIGLLFVLTQDTHQSSPQIVLDYQNIPKLEVSRSMLYSNPPVYALPNYIYNKSTYPRMNYNSIPSLSIDEKNKNKNKNPRTENPRDTKIENKYIFKEPDTLKIYKRP